MTGKEIKETRKKLGMTQTDVAIAVGVSLTAFQQWERGVSRPNPDNEYKLWKVLGKPGSTNK